jgi:hypothetical protein
MKLFITLLENVNKSRTSAGNISLSVQILVGLHGETHHFDEAQVQLDFQ